MVSPFIKSPMAVVNSLLHSYDWSEPRSAFLGFFKGAKVRLPELKGLTKTKTQSRSMLYEYCQCPKPSGFYPLELRLKTQSS